VLKRKIVTVTKTLLCKLGQMYLSMTQSCQTVLSQWAVLLKQALRSFAESHLRLKMMDFQTVLLYGGTITMPDGKTIIVMKYA